MIWEKLGQIFYKKNTHPLLVSHAANPLALHLHDDVFRVFYSGRDLHNKSSVSYVDIDIITQQVIYEHDIPCVEFGNDDSFFSHGISIGNLYKQNNKNYILFMGWQIRNNNHWRGDVGRLELYNNDTLSLSPNEAFMGVDEEDPISLSYPWVEFHEGIYKMWYGSTIDWKIENGEMIHVIKYATSIDGENWEKHGIAIPYEIGLAQAFSKPTVIINEEGYHMWYSYRSGRGEKYRIGYAQSLDGIKWENKLDKVGVTVSENGWDSEMICYPFVFKHKSKLYMIYNGNEHGKYGFGLAILK